MQLNLLVMFLCAMAQAESSLPPSAKNPEAVKRVTSGKLDTANAAWWGFDAEDSTDAIQSAIRSGAKRVVIPNLGRDWIVRPIQLAGNQELFFEPGVVVVAKRGEYRGKGDSVFRGVRLDNLTIRGYGAQIRMHKQDYIVGLVLKDLGWQRWVGQYDKAEWRMCLSLNGCSNVRIEGLTLRDSGGDGIYVAGSKKDSPSKNIHIKDVVCDNNYRQGISVISCDGLLVENSVFRNTWGTPPSSGVDIEPDQPEEVAKNIVFRGCRFEGNYGDGIEVFLSHLNSRSADVSILFENCHVSGPGGSGIRVSKAYSDGPKGSIVFRNCSVENTDGHGIKVQDKSANSAEVQFEYCTLRRTANDRVFASAWAPIWLQNHTPDKTGSFGGIHFVDCFVEDDKDRPVVLMQNDKGAAGISNLTGVIHARNPSGVRFSLGENLHGVALKVIEAPKVVDADPSSVRHLKVYYEPGRFGGWPANHGIWSWGNEILVGYGRGYYKDLGPYRHHIDRDKPEEHWLARSVDGGITWTHEHPAERGVLIPMGKALHGTETAGRKEKPWRDSDGGIDFAHPDFAMTVRMTDIDGGSSRYYVSSDRGRNWDGPFRLPMMGVTGVAARTDYVVYSSRECMLFLTGSKQNRREGRPFAARTTDGGKTWNFVSFIGPEPKGYSIMPATVRLNGNELLTAVRCRLGPRTWLEAYRSMDKGAHWSLDNVVVPDMGEGNPASMLRLADGRICVIYGFRAPPFSIRARLSGDGGRTWGPEIALRSDGSGRDIGYPRAVQRPDGMIVAVYYYEDAGTGPERYIAATIWDPPKAN